MSRYRDSWRFGVFVAMAACTTSSGTTPTQSAGGSSAANAGSTASALDASAANVDAGDDSGLTAYCPDGSVDSSTLNSAFSAKGKVFTAHFVQSTPSPPARYDNAWVIDFADATGAPASDLQMTKADTWMPFHSHGWPGHGTAMAQPGRFNVDINLNMPGYFRIDLDVSSPTLGADHLEFYYCYR